MNDLSSQQKDALEDQASEGARDSLELNASLQSLLSEARLMYAERLRYSESQRLMAEEKLLRHEDVYSETLDSYRADTRALSQQLSDAKEKMTQLLMASAETERRLEQSAESLSKKQVEFDATLSALEDAKRKAEADLSLLKNTVLEQTAAAIRSEGQVEILVSQLALVSEQKGHIEAESNQLNESLAETRKELKQSLAAAVDHEAKILHLNSLIAAANQQMLSDSRQFKNDVEELRHRVSKSSAEIPKLHEEIERYRAALAKAEIKVESLRNSTSFAIGAALISASQSFSAFVRLPAKLIALKKRIRIKLGGSGAGASVLQHESGSDQVGVLFAKYGPSETERIIRTRSLAAASLANSLTQLAKLVLTLDPPQAVRLARESWALDPKDFRSKWLAFLLFDCGNIFEANKLLAQLPKSVELSSSQRYRARYIAGCDRLLINEIDVPGAARLPAFQSVANSILYVASSSLPYHINGYTSRTQSLLKSLQERGWSVKCVTRPGYPFDRPDALVEPIAGVQLIDDVPYQVLTGPHRRKEPLDEYLKKSADIIEAKAREERPALIHAASNYEVALPALIAARRLGIPFVYEVRGLWEYTAASKNTGWEETERFALDRKLESLVSSNADAVLTLTTALSDELQARGVSAERVLLAPNAVNPSLYTPRARSAELAARYSFAPSDYIVGYIGSLVGYEGLDDLIAAVAELRERGLPAKLMIVGGGGIVETLKGQAKQLGIQEAVVFAGQVPPSEVSGFYSVMDVIALPRKPFKVCQLVSPLKPLEAMAMKIPLVVSDVAALKEMVEDEKTALVHISTDVTSLAAALSRLSDDTALRSKLAEAAYQSVMTSRTWQHVSSQVLACYSSCLNSRKVVEKDRGVEEENLELNSGTVLLHPGKNAMTADQKKLFDTRLSLAVKISPSALFELVQKQAHLRSSKFCAFCKLKGASALLSHGYVSEALQCAEEAISLDAGISTVRGAARIFYNAADMPRALEFAERICQAPEKTEADRVFVSEVRGRAQLIEWATAPASEQKQVALSNTVLNILAFSLPYTSVGYATRSHGLAQGIKNSGWEVVAYTRPGFPFDFKPELEGQDLALSDNVDGVVYRRLYDIKRSRMSEVDYLLEAVKHYERVIDEERPCIVHAASNYVTALPALIAARRKGIPFVYEVRGFWEVTRSSRDESFEHTGKYRFMQLFEALVAQYADRVITITTAMREELAERGVPIEKVTIAYNSVDPERFLPRPINDGLARRLGLPENVPVIGYIGSFVDYEGLDDLIIAAAELRSQGYEFRLLLVGDGAVYEALESLVSEFGLQSHVVMTGRVPHDEVEDYYSLIDIAPFPRKPWEVCELVSPLKPFEAMALQKAVIVSSTRALTEIVQDGHNGLIYEKGNCTALTQVLATLIADPERRKLLGDNARNWIRRERSWDVAGQAVAETYGKIIQVI